ncbi:MAG: energy transducer TonB [Alistipes sp.]|nr:energy transducer TonB [Alistipes sp.]
MSNSEKTTEKPTATPTEAGDARAVRPRRRPLRLPFDGRSQDAGSWAYDHRVGLCVTLIIYLLVAIGFVSSKIVMGGRASMQGMYIDLQTVEELERERDRLAEEVRRANEQIDWSAIRNTSSNENALNENLQDDRGTNTSALNSEAEAVEQRLRANRDAYERGVAAANAIGERTENDNNTSEGESDRKVKGRVTVSFSLTNPTRYSRHLIKPAYRCEGGGEVVVNIAVNQRGDVISAQVASGGDECMRQTAIKAARNSRFDYNESAPVRQTGTITYIFIPQ